MSINPNPILRRIRAQDITSEFDGARNTLAYREVLARIQSLGEDNPILYGGALRDLFCGKTPKDLDVSIHRDDIHAATRSQMKINGYTIDAMLKPEPVNLAEQALSADAPINAIAMNKYGTVLAHPQFIDHARKGIYAIREDLTATHVAYSLLRLHRLQEKHTDWTLQFGDTEKLIKAVDIFKSITGKQNVDNILQAAYP